MVCTNCSFMKWVTILYKGIWKETNSKFFGSLLIMKRNIYQRLCYLSSSNVNIIHNKDHRCCRWMLAYRDALAFRTSHYFVSYMSEVSALLAGLELVGVANPGSIEVPRSLGEVVVFWNMPMHHWLKTCELWFFICIMCLFNNFSIIIWDSAKVNYKFL